MKNKPGLLLLFVSLCALFCARVEAGVNFEWLPHGRPFRLTFADPREIRMGLDFEGDSKLVAAIGNYFSLFEIAPEDNDGDKDENKNAWRADFGLEGAGYFGLRHAESRFPLETADGLIGIYFEGSQGPWQAQFRYTHISAHLADGSSATPIAYSREFTQYRFAFAPSFNLEFYTGIGLIINSVPHVPAWSGQVGSNYFFPKIFEHFTPFVALDVKIKQETTYNPSVNLQLGVALNNPPEAYRSFRLFYEFYKGADYRGQFYNRPLTTHSLGIEMQI